MSTSYSNSLYFVFGMTYCGYIIVDRVAYQEYRGIRPVIKVSKIKQIY